MQRLPIVERSRRSIPVVQARYRGFVDFSILHARWVLPGAWAGFTAIFTAGGATAGFDAAALPWIGGVVGVVVAGFLAGLAAVWRGRRVGWLGICGWAVLPIIHFLATARAGEGWAPTFFADLFGVLAALVLAGAAIVAAFFPAVPGSRWERLTEAAQPGTHERATATTQFLIAVATCLAGVTFLISSCGQEGRVTSGSSSPTVTSTTSLAPASSIAPVTSAAPQTATSPVPSPPETTTRGPASPETVVVDEDVPAHFRYGADGLWRIGDGRGEQLVAEPVWWAADDLMGGVVFDTVAAEPAVYWLREGASTPTLIVPHGNGVAVIAVDDRPVLVFAAEGAGDVDLEVHVGLLDLAAGTSSVSDVVMTMVSEDGGLYPNTAGGALVAGVENVAVGAGGTSNIIGFWDMAGRRVEIAANPFPTSCAPCTLTVRLSPDGEKLAYVHRPDAKWPAPEYDHLTPAEWWDLTRSIPGQLTVIDLEDGRAVFRLEIPAGGGLADFDGRYAVVVRFPRIEGDSVESTIYDTTGADDDMTLPGIVHLSRQRLGWSAPEPCSGGVSAPISAQRGLPEVAARTRSAIAAPAAMWGRLESAGTPVLARIEGVLGLPAELAALRHHEGIGHTGLRAGIRSDGVWVIAAARD